MRKILILFTAMLLSGSEALIAQTTNNSDFVLTNPTINPNPAVYPGGTVTITYDFYVNGDAFTFSSDDLSNDFAVITFSFTKMNPSAVMPTGTGAALFNWRLSNNGGSGAGLTYTWTGSTKDVTMVTSPPNPKYKIIFTSVPVTMPATPAEVDIRVAGQFTDPGNAPTGNSGNNFAQIATYTTAGGTTPITLLDFTAKKINNTTAGLEWQTATEQNSDRFEIERSADGINFFTIAKLAAAGYSVNRISYSREDRNTLRGDNYYRLKMVDKDGSFTYSAMRKLNFGDADINISAYPNPFVDKLNVSVTANKTGEVMVTLIDNTGKLLLTQRNNVQRGLNIISVNNLSKLPGGTYFLRVAAGDQIVTVKLTR
jgi:hypothetical protein